MMQGKKNIKLQLLVFFIFSSTILPGFTISPISSHFNTLLYHIWVHNRNVPEYYNKANNFVRNRNQLPVPTAAPSKA